MHGKDAFSQYHPLVQFVYFGLVLGFSMACMHPVCLLLSLLGAALYAKKICGEKSVKRMFGFLLASVPLIVLISPAFNHRGVTVLCYLPGGSSLTLESILYGVAAGALFAAAFLWFGCCTAVMTGDRLMDLFGRVIPALSLVLSMTMRFVPRFMAQLDAVREAQTCVTPRGEATRAGRLRAALSAFSVTVTWALENGVETADSMKSRGWGLKGRRSFSVHPFTTRDRYVLLWLGFCGVYLLCGGFAGALSWRWYPNVHGALFAPLTLSMQFVYGALCVTPLVLDGREEQKWKSSRFKI